MRRLRMVRAAFRRKAPSPLGAVARGLIAGALGAGAQSLFLLATKRFTPESKKQAARAVHYLFGAAWGGLYALCRESFRTSPLLFGLGVWALSDNVLSPAFRVAARPQHDSLEEHHSAAQAHVVYGLSTAAAYALLRDLGPVPLAAVPATLLLQAWAWVLRTPPARLLGRGPRRFLYGTLVQKAALA